MLIQSSSYASESYHDLQKKVIKDDLLQANKWAERNALD